MTTPTIDILDGKRVLRLSETCVQAKPTVEARIRTLHYAIETQLPEAIVEVSGQLICQRKAESLTHQIDRLTRARGALDPIAEKDAARGRLMRRMDQMKARVAYLESIVEDLDE